MALHLVGLPWTELTKEWEAEAFTARTRVLGSMLSRYGTVIAYGGERNESRVTEYVPIVDRQWQARHFPGFRTTDVFTDYEPRRPAWIEFGVRAADAIRERAKPDDFLGITMGAAQQMIVDLTADLGLTVVEVGVGYKGVINHHRVYESQAWRTFHAGRLAGYLEATGDPAADVASDIRNFDATIPRPYEVEDFRAGTGDGGYFLFMGRVVARKGAAVASQTCQRLGAKLVVVGQNVTSAEPGRIVSADGTVLEGDVEFAGIVGPEERAQLLGGAIATFTPTLYLEPFGGVHAESLLTGTPVITVPWGCFDEFIDEGVNGFKCSTLDEFVQAGRNAEGLNRSAIRRRAVARYGTETVGPQYDAYFRKLRTLAREGWYELPPRPIHRAA